MGIEAAIKGLLERVWNEGYIAAEWDQEEVCNCDAWNIDECACGNYGNGHSRKENPYRNGA